MEVQIERETYHHQQGTNRRVKLTMMYHINI